MDQPPLLSVLSKEIVSPDTQNCDNFVETFTLTGIIGEGGSSYVLEAVSNSNILKFGIIAGQRVAIKLCKGDILDIMGCDAYVKEANLLRKITILNRNGICYNFPVYYMYGKCCLFYQKGQFDDIEEKLPGTCNLPYDKKLYEIYKTKEYVVPDLLIHYANTDTPNNNIKKYDKTCLRDIKRLFQLDNFHVLGKKWTLGNFNDNAGIYNFIVGDSDVNCGNYIVMSKINGTSLDKLGSSYILGYDLVFEMMYSNACLIKNYGFVLADRHDDNIMILQSEIPRIYKLGSYYLLFDTEHTYYSIDVQVTTTKSFNNINDLISVSATHLSNSMGEIISFLSKNKYSLDKFMTEVLSQVYKNYLIDKPQVDELMDKDKRIQIAEFK